MYRVGVAQKKTRPAYLKKSKEGGGTNEQNEA